MKIKQPSNQLGFTIVELLMATAVFSVVLMIITTGIIKIGQSYYKGLIQNKTQESARTISEEISRNIQLANTPKNVPDPANPNRFCIGTVRYTAYPNQKVEDATASPITTGIKAETVAPNGCSAPDDPATQQPRQLLSKNMRLLKFEVKNDPSSQQKTWRVDIRLAYGDNELLTHYINETTPVSVANVLTDAQTANCKSGTSGSNFCATAQLNNLVKRRLISN